MNASLDAKVLALRAAAAKATQAREGAHQRIVAAFRDHLHGAGPGPADADLQRFARLALVEKAVQKELGFALALATGAFG